MGIEIYDYLPVLSNQISINIYQSDIIIEYRIFRLHMFYEQMSF